MHGEIKSTMTVGEPCMENPNSKKAVTNVINHIRKVSSVGYERKWTIVHCDGVPYYFAAKMQDDRVICGKCAQEISCHQTEEHSRIHTHIPSHKNVFDDIVLRPGPGHFELNMAKVLLNLCWLPFLSEFGKTLGFRSPKAQDVLKNGIDHHRSREVLEISLQALSSELLLPYIRDCKRLTIQPSAENYQKLIEEKIKSNNYMFFYHLTFSYLLAFHLYTEAVRKNHSKRIMAARVIFAPLFYTSHHPKYQYIHVRNLYQRVQYPHELKTHIETRESFTVSGISNRGQGADFVHEEVPNRLIKSFLPPGMPSAETWQRLCRKAADLRDVKNRALNQDRNAGEGSKRRLNHSMEVTALRKMFRMNQQGFSDYGEDGPVLAFSNVILDYDLANVKILSSQNYQKYKESFKLSGIYGKEKLQPLFVTVQERNEYTKIENKTKHEISQII